MTVYFSTCLVIYTHIILASLFLFFRRYFRSSRFLPVFGPFPIAILDFFDRHISGRSSSRGSKGCHFNISAGTQHQTLCVCPRIRTQFTGHLSNTILTTPPREQRNLRNTNHLRRSITKKWPQEKSKRKRLVKIRGDVGLTAAEALPRVLIKWHT